MGMDLTGPIDKVGNFIPLKWVKRPIPMLEAAVVVVAVNSLFVVAPITVTVLKF